MILLTLLECQRELQTQQVYKDLILILARVIKLNATQGTKHIYFYVLSNEICVYFAKEEQVCHPDYKDASFIKICYVTYIDCLPPRRVKIMASLYKLRIPLNFSFTRKVTARFGLCCYSTDTAFYETFTVTQRAETLLSNRDEDDTYNNN